MASTGSSHVYFTRLRLSNVRSFGESQDLILTGSDGRPARWTLILGDNGVGKTTLLQALALMRPVPTVGESTATNTPKPERIEPAILQQENAELIALARTAKEIVELDAHLVSGRPLQGRGRSRELKTSANFRIRGGDLVNVSGSQERRPNFKQPLVIGYGAARHMRYRLSEPLNPEIDATASLFDPSLELADAKTILEDLDYASYKKQPHASELLEAVKSALATLLPDVPDAAAIRLYGPATPGSQKQRIGVQVVTPYGEVPLGALSLGYQTMTAWAVDLAWRLYQHYPEVSDPLHQSAIVLIDELDLHLHPRWQRQIRSYISAAFPQVQFIATAHSPLLAQTYLDTNLAVVRQQDGQAVIENDPQVIRTWRLDEVVTSALYEINSPFSPEIEQALGERTMLLQKPQLTVLEKARLAELEPLAAVVSAEPRAEDAEAMDVIRRAAQLLNSHSE
jgi:hypothetical protein